jgi:hypothetical protein
MKLMGDVVETKWGVVDVLCDLCQKPIRVDEQRDEPSSEYYASLSVTGGYFSPVLPDGIATSAELCEGCWVIARKTLEGIGVRFTDKCFIGCDNWL